VPSEEVFLKRAKHLMLVPMARYLRNEPPVEPDLVFVPKGHWKRWSRERLRSFRGKNTHLWYSFLQGKRGAEAVSPEIVLSNFRKHRLQMLSPDPIGETEDEYEFLDGVLDAIGPVLRRLAKQIELDLTPYFESPEYAVRHAASTKASEEASRKLGGQAGHIRGLIRYEGSILSRGDLFSMSDRSGVFLNEHRLVENPVPEVRHRMDESESLAKQIHDVTRLDSIPRYRARIEAVLEPLKVRTISKGPSLPYYIAKPVQRAIHTRMRRMEPFRLIGRPFCPTDLVDLRVAQERIGLGDDERWLSIDYSAATDGLSAALSQEILARLLSRLSVKNLGLYRLLLGVLAPHHITYPKVADVQLESVDQANGQLMGSILSFPVLCLANLALYLVVRATTRPEASVSDLLKAVLINGDDMIYIGTEREWELHTEIGRHIGLAMSPGKAYIHRKYANINSVSVHYDLDQENSSPRVIGFLNVGLFFGNHKVMGKVGSDDVSTSSPVSSVINEVVSGAWIGKQVEVLSSYLALHRDALRKEARGRNLFLPVSSGGMGVDAVPGFEFFISERQREWIAGLRRKYPYLQPYVRPMPCGRELREVSDHMIDPVREVVAMEENRRHPPKGAQMLSLNGEFGLVPYLLSYSS
jgi:hypothetical protein